MKNKNKLFYFSGRDEDWDKIIKVAKRRGTSTSKILTNAVKEYLKKYDDEPQSKMEAFTVGGAQNLHQLVGKLRQHFKSRGFTTKKEILDTLKAEHVNGPERVSVCTGIIKWLKHQGVEVLE